MAVTSDRGDFDHTYSSVAPTADGGAVVALKLRHLSNDLYNDNNLIRFVEEDGNKVPFVWNYPASRVYQGVLAKVSAAGKVEWTKLIPVDYTPVGSEKAPAVTDAIYFGGLAVDENGNIYLGGRHAKPITFTKQDGGEVSIIPQNTANWDGDSQKTRGDFFLVKLDSNGNFIWNLTANGVVTYHGISDLTYDNGKLYIYGNIQGDDALTTQLGGVVIKPTAKIDSFTARIDVSGTTPQVDWAKHFKAAPLVANGAGGRNKLTSINYQDGVLFSSGAINGIIADADGNEIGKVPTANQLKGFILKQNAENGNVESFYLDNVTTGIGEIENAYFVNNKIYAFGHVMGTIFLFDMDASLSNAAKTTVLTSGSATTLTSALIENQVVGISRGQGTTNVLKDGSLSALTSAPAYSSLFVSYEVTEIGTAISENIQVDDLVVYGDKGEIIVIAPEVNDIAVYNVYGQLVRKLTVVEGENTIEGLTPGVYIVAKQKVLVK